MVSFPSPHPIYFHSWHFLMGIAFATTRVLTQTLSNLVTGNQELLDQFWSVHMEIPEEQSVLM
jgi:ataxin-10